MPLSKARKKIRFPTSLQRAPKGSPNLERAHKLRIVLQLPDLVPFFRKFLHWCAVKAEKAGLHDWLMVLFTALLTIVAVMQVWIVWQNSKIGTVQTEKFITAAQRIDAAADSFSGSAANINQGVASAVKNLNLQAAATHDLALATGNQAAASKAIAERAAVQASAAQVAAEAAKQQAQTAAEQLELSERPWLDAHVSVDSSLYYNPNGANLTLKVSLLDSGLTPAIEVAVYAKFFPETFDKKQRDLEKAQVCGRAADSAIDDTTAFPSNPIIKHIHIRLAEEDVQKHSISGFIYPQQIVFCVAYSSAVARSKYTSSHVYDFYRVEAQQLGRFSFLVNKETLKENIAIGDITDDEAIAD